MSLLGKLLAVLNLLGVVCLFLLLGADNLKRETWQRAVLMHDLAADGLPLDDKELDMDGRVRADALTEPVLREHFYGRSGQAEGNEALPKTQSEAVLQLRQKLDAKIGEKTTSAERVEVLCRILLPLANTFSRHDELLALHTHLVADPVNDRLRLDLRDAILAAIEDSKQSGKPFDKAFREKIHERLAGSSQFDLIDDFLKALPADGKAELLAEAVRKAANVSGTGRLTEFMRTARQVNQGSGDELLSELYAQVYAQVGPKTLKKQLASAVRPALLAMRNPRPKYDPANDPGREKFYATFLDRGGEPADFTEDNCRRAFLAHFLEALDAQGGDPKGAYAVALVEKGFPGARFKTALEKAAREAEWPLVGLSDTPGVAEDKRPEVVFLRALVDSPDDPAKIIDDAFGRVLDVLAADLREDFEKEFRDPGSPSQDFTEGAFQPSLAIPLRRANAARLLASLNGVAFELENKPNAPDADGYTPALWRAGKVAGLRWMNVELSREYRVLNAEMLPNAKLEIDKERHKFLEAHAALLKAAQDRAFYLERDKAELKGLVDQSTEKQKIINRRMKDTEYYTNEMKAEVQATAGAVKQLETMSRELYEIRVRVRNATRLNKEYLEAIKDLEERYP